MAPKNNQLHNLATYTKIFIQFIFLITITFLPFLFPNLEFTNRKELSVILLIAVSTSIIYEVIIRYYEHKNIDSKNILILQLLTSVILLSFFLHFFNRINGPLFIIYGLTIMESSLNLNIHIALIVIGIMISATVGEWVWLVLTKEVVFNITNTIYLIIRVLYLFLMSNYSQSLAKTILAEREVKTHIQELYAKLARAHLHLKELDRLKDELISIASHELRTPMTAIKGYLWMALHKSPHNLDPKLKKYLNVAFMSTDHLIKLVQDMLTVSRIEGNKFELITEEFNLFNLITNIYNELKIKADEKKISFNINTTSKDLKITGDKNKIEEVIENVIDNALKFTPQGGQITINLSSDSNLGSVTVAISDTGLGISESNIPKLFQKFGRLEHSYTRISENTGTGLGLYISKKIIEMHHGKIEVESTVGKGSTFKIHLPFSPHGKLLA